MLPIGDRVIVEPIEESASTASGLIITKTVKDRFGRGKVASILMENDYIAVGDIIIYDRSHATEIAKSVVVVDIDDIYAKE